MSNRRVSWYLNQIDYLLIINKKYRLIHLHSFEQPNNLLGTTTSNNTSKIVGKSEEGEYDKSWNDRARNLQRMKDTAKSCKGERSCIKPVVHEHFRKKGFEQKKISESIGVERLIDRFASTAKNNSKPTEKPDPALNVPNLSQTAISNTDLTLVAKKSTTTDITE